MTGPGPTMGTLRTGVSAGAHVIASGAEVRRPALHERADAINSAVDNIEKILGGLRERLEPVILPSVPTQGPELAAVRRDDDMSSWIAGYLDDLTGRLHRIAFEVSAFTARVDL